MDFSALHMAMDAIGADIDADFDRLLPVPDDARASLYKAMRYSAIGGGKRLRPLLLVTIAEMHGVDRAVAVRAACAVEAIHVYSLIHDDLPCMDDDAMRRGKPTLHLAFDEATAVLAGDSLHDMAFAILADGGAIPDPFVRIQLVQALADASGPAGMAGGQMMDLMAEKSDFDLAGITRLQQLKTGALIAVSVEMGAILGHVSPDNRTHLRGYAHDIGLAFQIADDLLDAEGDEAKAGKALRKDADAGKATFLSILGVERARAQADMLVEQAVAHLAAYGAEADVLRQLAHYIVKRDR